MIDVRVNVGREVFVSDLDSVVDDGNGDVRSEKFVPNFDHVDIKAGDAGILAGVVEVPLVVGVRVAPSKAGIVGDEFREAASGQEWSGGNDAGKGLCEGKAVERVACEGVSEDEIFFLSNEEL